MVDKGSTLAWDMSARIDSVFSGWDVSHHAITNGQLVVTPSPSTNAYHILASTQQYDFNGAGTSIECIQTLNVGSGAPETGYQIKNDINNYVYILKNGSNLIFREKVAGSNSDQSVTYNNTTHRFWRLRGLGTTAYWETSPDGFNWTVQRSKTTTLNLAAMNIEIIAGTFNTATAAPGAAIFDNLNMPHQRAFMAFI